MVLEHGALSGRYSPENPLPEGSNRAETYNGMLPQLKALTDKLALIGRKRRGAEAPDVATAWAIAKGRRRSSALPSPIMSMVWSEPAASRSPQTKSQSWKLSPTPLT